MINVLLRAFFIQEGLKCEKQKVNKFVEKVLGAGA